MSLLTALPALNAGTVVRITTGLGDIYAELYDADKPVTVANYLSYVRSNAYQNSFFHRCVPGFALQGGGYATFAPMITNRLAPPWANLGLSPNYGTITNEFGVGRRLSNTFGTLAMAKVGTDPNSASSQWFFNLNDNSANLDHQNGGFTVFGRVIQGADILASFNGLTYGANLVNLQSLYPADPVAPLFTELPTYALGTNAPPYNQLVYFNVQVVASPVRAAVTLGGEVSWNSTAGRTNVIEFSTQLPPVWQTLVSTNGTGEVMRHLDATPAGGPRFYRVRIDY